MRNPFTFQIESYSGAVFMLLVGAFFASFMYIAIKNFDTDIETLDAQHVTAKIKTISPAQRELMEIWMRENGVELPEGESLRWLIRKYPDRPWLKAN